MKLDEFTYFVINQTQIMLLLRKTNFNTIFCLFMMYRRNFHYPTFYYSIEIIQQDFHKDASQKALIPVT